MRLFAGLRRGGRSWRKNESGATAIEFAMVIGPFLGVLFAVIEVGLVYFAQISIENANEAAARVFRTGQAQKQHWTQNRFKQQICKEVATFIGCDGNLIVDVRSHDTFAEMAEDLPNPLSAAGGFNPNYQAAFNPGGPSQVVLVTVFYDWKLFIGMPGLGDFTGKLGLGLGNMPDGSRLISSGFIGKTEPYQ
jgi:Flp pilus assembly protein TadG